MKRALLFASCTPVTALWFVNWKQSHPKATQADKQFARLIRGADEVQVSSYPGHQRAQLRGKEMHSLVEETHLYDRSTPRYSSCHNSYTLHFKREGDDLAIFDLDFDASGLRQSSSERGQFNLALGVRTGRELKRLISNLMDSAPFAP